LGWWNGYFQSVTLWKFSLQSHGDAINVQSSDNIELLLFVQECQDYHQAKDGDGWVEQSGQSFFFGIFQKVIELCSFFSTMQLVIMWQPIFIMGM
jgi:hypothetical protein